MTNSTAPQLSEDEKTNLYHLVSKEMEANKFEPAVLSRAQIEFGPDAEQVRRAYSKLRYEQLVRRIFDRRSADEAEAVAGRDKHSRSLYSPREPVIGLTTPKAPPQADATPRVVPQATLTPLVVPQASATPSLAPSQGVQDPRFFSPVAIAVWTIFIGAVFGSYMLGKNWKDAGQHSKAKEAWAFGVAYVSMFFILPFISMEKQTVFAIWILGYAVLCIALVMPQNAFLKRTYGESYSRQPAISWILPMIGGLIFLAVLSTASPFIISFAQRFMRGFLGE